VLARIRDACAEGQTGVLGLPVMKNLKKAMCKTALDTYGKLNEN